MCFPDAFASGGMVETMFRDRSNKVNTGVYGEANPSFNPFIKAKTRAGQAGGGFGGRLAANASGKSERAADILLARRAGMSEEDAKRLATFAANYGGIDQFESIEAARRAMRDRRAFTEDALVPAGPEAVSRFVARPVNTQKVGAAELRGLPLITRR